MAGGGVVAAGEVRHYPGRTTFFVCMVCVVAASGGLMFGYDVGISGTHCRLRWLEEVSKFGKTLNSMAGVCVCCEDGVVGVAGYDAVGAELIDGRVRVRWGWCRGSDIHGRVPGEVLPDGVGEEEYGHGEYVLQVRRSKAGGVHVVALHLGASVHLLLVVHHAALGPQGDHAHRGRSLLLRCHLHHGRARDYHAHHRPCVPGLGRGLRQPGGAAVPLGDGAVQVAWSAQHPVPARGHRGHPLGQPGELRHREDGAQRLARLAGHCRHPGRLHHAGRYLAARHA